MEPQNPDLFLRLMQFDWPDQNTYFEFSREVEILWGTLQGRATVERWLTVLGKNDIWTIEQLKAHFSEGAIPPLPIPQLPTVKRGPGRPRIHNPTADYYRPLEIARTARREALRTSRELVKIEQLRHAELMEDWDRYVDSVKESCDAAQKSAIGS